MAKQVSIKTLLRTNDAFLTTSEKALKYFQSHTKLIVALAAALILVLTAALTVRHVHRSDMAKAMAAYHQTAVLTDQNERAAALQKIREDYADSPASRQAAFSLLNVYLAEKKLDEAIGLSEELLKNLTPSEDSLKPLLLNVLGGLHEEKGQPAEALAQYKAALQLIDPEAISFGASAYAAELNFAIGRTALAIGDAAEAQKAFENIVLQTPNSMRAYSAQVKLAQLGVADVSGQAGAVSPVEPSKEAAESENAAQADQAVESTDQSVEPESSAAEEPATDLIEGAESERGAPEAAQSVDEAESAEDSNAPAEETSSAAESDSAAENDAAAGDESASGDDSAAGNDAAE
ncbi:MAG: hypothetical protein LBJ64_10920 [Deltaproteobacteria bacterium]|jgi:tetratricopeptide (TPR) repeat protein|nr:hypothetical protein [Deltaproteobacteria bacterium]